MDRDVVVIGGGVVGCALAYALSARGVDVLLAEAEPALAMDASGTNSGILHTGFDSVPGLLETRLILRSAELRADVIAALGIPVWECGARLRPRDRQERTAIDALAVNARINGVAAERCSDGGLRVPGESVTDPVVLTRALAQAALSGGATIRLGAEVVAISPSVPAGISITLSSGEQVRAAGAVNCGGLRADELALLAGEDLLEVYPRKGEFMVFAQPTEEPLREILLPVPSAAGKGVLVFPTLGGQVIAGPTARDRIDKRDWSVEPDAAELILGRARELFPPLQASEPIAAYAGLRPAGRGVNYVIEPSRSLAGLIHVAAIRSTGLTAALGIAEHVTGLLLAQGIVGAAVPRTLAAIAQEDGAGLWWQAAALRSSPHGQGR